MRQALDMAFFGTCMLILAYMCMSIIGFYDGRCLIGMGVIAAMLLGMARSVDDEQD
ncbi:MAG: hypothetical protein ACW99G_11415 [Candidatus Thorarchaeota archaeon]|jgi:hypothetical protein